MDSEKSIDQFAKEMQAAGFSFELKAVRHSDGLTLATRGFIEEEDFLKAERCRKLEQRAAQQKARGRGYGQN